MNFFDINFDRLHFSKYKLTDQCVKEEYDRVIGDSFSEFWYFEVRKKNLGIDLLAHDMDMDVCVVCCIGIQSILYHTWLCA